MVQLMDDVWQLVSTLMDSVAFIMAMVFVVSLLQRKSENQRLLTFLRGAVFSAGVMFTMANPIDLGTAGIYDMRGLLIGTAGALLGPVAGLMAMLTALAIRLGIGGNGLARGILSIVVAFGAGLIWRRFVPGLILPHGKSFAFGGGNFRSSGRYICLTGCTVG
jgi:diguanylate cyclase